MASKRINGELSKWDKDPVTGTTIALASESNIHKWNVVLEGPSGTAYAGGKFGVVVSLPADYPFKPPVVNFTTPIYHPNITNEGGNICIGILKPDNWKPAMKVRDVLEAVRNLLVEPQPDDPLETAIATQYKEDRATFEQNVKTSVKKNAMKQPKFPAA